MCPTHRKGCKRYDIPGHAHYLTFSCYQRRPLLAAERPRQWLLEALCAARSRIAFDLWAYVIMPEHVHLLVWPRDGTPVSEILRHVKLPVAKRALRCAQHEDASLLARMAPGNPLSRSSTEAAGTTGAEAHALTARDGTAPVEEQARRQGRKRGSPHGGLYHFWQRGGGYDRNIWSPREMREKIAYIHANPARRGMVTRPEDWPWSSWAAWNGDAAPPVPIDYHSLPPLNT
jgi:putative transposase